MNRRRGGKDPKEMAPPPSVSSSSGAPAVHPIVREVTEDTPPDLLEGTMDLLVLLPSGRTVQMTIERKTPMMDLLIHIGTVNKLNPGDHIVQIRNERGFELPYKPSTPIGALDTTAIEIVPKSRVSDYIIVKKPAKVANQPFEHTFRLQVHLPRNQLHVMRVSMKTVLEDILREVCQEKNLNMHKYEVRHPGNLEEKLPLHGTLGQFGLHEITVVSKNAKINTSVSTADIIALEEEARGKGYFDSFKHSRSSVGDSSVSSGSTGSASRGLSPTRSDDSRSVSPSPYNPGKISHRSSSTDVRSPPHSSGVHKCVSMSNMFSPGTNPPPGVCPPPRHKKRAAPRPPPLLKSQTESQLQPRRKDKEAPRPPATGSDFQRSHDSGLNDNQHFRYDRQASAPAMLAGRAERSKSSSNLTTTSSLSNTSLASSSGASKKRRAPVPPSVPLLEPHSQIEEEESEASGYKEERERGQESGSNPTEPISVITKEEESYISSTSTPVSSLSSPGSYLTSASIHSSPRELGSSSVPFPVGSEALNMQAGSGPASAGSNVPVSAPLPPPRTKSKEEESAAPPQPKPRPKPRPDRGGESAAPSTVEDHKVPDPEPPQPVHSHQLRNPLAKYGVKVLPENVLKERADRLARAASTASQELEDESESSSGGESSDGQKSRQATSKVAPQAPSQKRAAPPPPKTTPTPTTQSESPVKPPLPPSSKNSAFQTKKSESEEKPFKLRVKQDSLDEDSDGLEENLELFDLRPSSSTASQPKPKPKVTAPNIPKETSIAPKGPSARVSDFQDLRKKTSSSDNSVEEGDLMRTNSERHRDSKGSLSSESQGDGKLLNRWQNLESLNEIDDRSNATNKRVTNKEVDGRNSLDSNTSSSKLSKFHTKQSKDASFHTDSGHEYAEDAGITSSGSEISYTDSGVPATEAITPSPMDLDSRISDHWDEHVEERKKSGSRTSSRSSYHSDDGEQWKKVLEQKASNSAAAQETAFTSMFGEHNQAKYAQVVESKDAPSPVPEPSPVEEQDHSSQRKSSSDSSQSRRVSKSESFSHNSEFDMVNMRRKKFASKLEKEVDGNRTSSEEDVVGDREHSRSRRRSSEDSNKGKMQKTTSLVGIQEASDNPDLSKKFQSQMEQQFEQWKLDFLKEHGLESSSDPPASKKESMESSEAQPVSAVGSTSTKMEESNFEETTSPKDPPVHASSSSSEDEESPQILRPVEPFDEESFMRPKETRNVQPPPPHSPSPTLVVLKGPPTINMGSWSERPRTNVSVKKDDDYIMGYGQAKPKTSSETPSRPTSMYQMPASPMKPVTVSLERSASKAEASPKPATFRAVVDAVKPPKPAKGISAVVNARPVTSSSADTTDSPSSVKSILSTWKQRVEGAGEDRRVPQGPPPEIDMYGNGNDNTTESAKPSHTKSEASIDRPSKGIQKQPSLRIVDVGSNVNVKMSQERFGGVTEHSKPTPVEKAVPPPKPQVTVTQSKPSATLFKISSMDSRHVEIVNPQSNKADSSPSLPRKDAIAARKAEVSLDLTKSQGENDSSQSLNDRKKYFQGVQPVESPSREVPLPAVNMKSSIATIQKVFEQRQSRSNSPSPAVTPTSTLQKSKTLPSQHTMEAASDPVIVITAPQQNRGESQTMPKSFQSMTSAEMVQRVLGKNRPAQDTFRRSPSPLSSSTSTLSRTSSGRDTPASSISIDVTTDNSSRSVSQEHSPIKHVGNKSVIIVSGQPPSNPEPTQSVSNNIFKLQHSNSSATRRVPLSESRSSPFNYSNSTTIVINSSPAPKKVEEPKRVVEIESPPKVVGEKKMSTGTTIPAGSAPPPPPPPPPSAEVNIRPKNISLNGRPKSAVAALYSPSSSKTSTPSSPGSPDPRSEIFNVIKNSNGNFGLKKTGSSFLLK